MTKTPNQSSGFFAVRKGKGGLQRCIFLDWKDCQTYVEGETDSNAVEYHVFDEFEQAIRYLKDTPAAATAASVKSPVEDAQLLASIETIIQHNENKDTTTDKNEKTAAAAAAETSTSPAKQSPKKAPASAKKGEKKAAASPKKPPAKRQKVDDEEKTRLRRPTKKWEECFALLKEAYEKHGVRELVDYDEKVERWIRDQRYHYSLYQQGKPSSKYEEKVRRMEEIGFVFSKAAAAAPNAAAVVIEQESNTGNAELKPKAPRKIRKTWYESRDKLKAYMDSHDGRWEIDKKDRENAKLREWVADQQCEYRKMVKGGDSSMTAEKVQLLQEIGFQFSYITFNRRMEQLKAYHTEHGNLSIPPNHPLGKYMKSLRRQARDFKATNKPTRDLNAQRLAQLEEIGFVANAATMVSKKTQEQDDADWEASYGKLQEYKRAHGHCHVQRDQDKDLYNWIINQRKNYKRLRDDKSSKLSVPRLMKLNDLGFQFSVRGSYESWETRVEQLRQFKAQHGHINIPISQGDLGEFCARQRKEYRKRLDNEKSSMTPERIQILSELGFNFGAGLRRDKAKMAPPKTWEERFQELLSFKEEYGHTIVPQHSQEIPGLASWVKTQRKNYKHMLAGKKTSMTPQKAYKLQSVGFVFDVFDRTKKRKRGDAAHESEDEY